MQPILKKWKLLIFCGIALIVLGFVADHLFTSKKFQPTEQSNVQIHWQRVTNLQCGFAVTFPSKPFRNPQSVDDLQNVTLYKQFASVLGDQVFMVTTAQTSQTNYFSSEQIPLILDSIGETMKGMGKFIEERDITLGTNMGREFEVQYTNGSFLKTHCYIIGDNIQQVTVTQPQPFTSRDSTNITYFLDSFSLISK